MLSFLKTQIVSQFWSDFVFMCKPSAIGTFLKIHDPIEKEYLIIYLIRLKGLE